MTYLHLRRGPGLVVAVVVAAALAACGSPDAPVADRSSTTTATSSSTGSTAATGSAQVASTIPVATGPRTTGPTTTPSAPAITTTVPPPLPLSGTGVRGRVTAAPTCPVERPDQPCPPVAVHARVAAIAGDGRTAASADTDETGRYALGLAPGTYTLRIGTDGVFPRCSDEVVTVASGPPQTVDIDCDTGIR